MTEEQTQLLNAVGVKDTKTVKALLANRLEAPET